MGRDSEVITPTEATTQNPSILFSRTVDTELGREVVLLTIDPTNQNWTQTEAGWLRFAGFVFRGPGDIYRYAHLQRRELPPSERGLSSNLLIQVNADGVGRQELGKIKPFIPRPRYVHAAERIIEVDINYDSSQSELSADLV